MCKKFKFLDIPSVEFFYLSTELVYSLSCETGLLQVDFYSHKVLFMQSMF